ncbi:MAG: RNA polymerase sigma factor, partial [Myxococcaceae bacterium]
SRGLRARSDDGGVQCFALHPLDLADAHQETFIRAFSPSARSSYDGLRPYLTFLLAIARAAAADVLRGKGKLAREAVPLDDAPELGNSRDEHPDPEQQALSAEVQGLVNGFLAGLSETDRELARGRFAEGQPQQALGASLGLTRAEIRTREGHLKRAFVRHLREHGWLNPSAGAR